MSPNRRIAVYLTAAIASTCLDFFCHGLALPRNPIRRHWAPPPPQTTTVPANFRQYCSVWRSSSRDVLFLSSSVTDEVPSSVIGSDTSEDEDKEESNNTSQLPINATQGVPASSTGIATSSQAAQWHKQRRKEMLQKYSDRISPLERSSSSNVLGLSLLFLSNASLLAMAYLSGKAWNPLQIFLAAIFPGSMFSLWTLQILHDCLHGSLLPKPSSRPLPSLKHDNNNNNHVKKKKKLQSLLLFWGSMPSFFGYHLYLRHGHLSHHKSLGDPRSTSLRQLFDSDKSEFEDGDVLFAAHRMKLKGEAGPRFRIGKEKKEDLVLSISRTGFSHWKRGRPLRNAAIFAATFSFERFLLGINDLVVALTGTNYFFPNKPREFHKECANYCRWAVLVRGALWKWAGWKSLLFLYLAEILWSIPPHPACAMFVTNHGSATRDEDGDGYGDGCIPSSSTYAGKWYSLFTLGTNYHCEHHDFPTIPLHRLGKLREIAPEYYREGERDNVFEIMWKVFSEPEFYACMDVGVNLKNTKILPVAAS
mmetsp:Transcript_22690/g.45939  ORF Transcript_22690/g.45939 Transcript_22690/m.45939 type:complete len:534 (-) Transcript_22690:121-1722(-)